MTVTEIETQAPSPAFMDDEDRWTAVRRRDVQADGAFYYSVDTTGVYCRPSCAARLARRENVRFHLTPDAAEKAGFRACKRCRPNQPALAAQHALTMAKACRVLKDSSELPDLNELAAASAMSRFHFQRVFKSVTGVTPRAYFVQNRSEKVREELSRSKTVTDAIYNAGFNSNGRFYATSSQVLGMTPTVFRSGGLGTSVRFAIGECSVGAILVAATEKGICSIMLGDDPDALVHQLEHQLPKAQLVGGDKEFEQWVAKVVGLVDSPAQPFDLPLDVRGTAFQQRVWCALREIPLGSTASYAEIAARLGTPSAVRAVARACASNSLALVIPCHRVVRSDGGLAGYRWGVERKRALLDREASA